ncbi:MAG: hypothetical protein IT305_12080 [Chloroflexi bacterium]|nr:hypothetical protein [Chloroflexota bacterium]
MERRQAEAVGVATARDGSGRLVPARVLWGDEMLEVAAVGVPTSSQQGQTLRYHYPIAARAGRYTLTLYLDTWQWTIAPRA